MESQGEIRVLNVGAGDNKIIVDLSTDETKENAQKMIEDMLKRGYSLFVQTKNGSMSRVKSFRKTAMEYIVTDSPDPIAVDKVKTTAIAPTAGG